MLMEFLIKHLQVEEEEPLNEVAEEYEEDVQEDVQIMSFDRSNSVQGDERSVYTNRKTVHDVSHGQDWTHRAQRNAINYRPVSSISVTINLLLLSFMLYLTYISYKTSFLVCGYALLFAIFLLTDPISCFERYLANKSRYLLSCAIILVIVAYSTENLQLWKVTAIIDAVFLFLTYNCNKKWIIQETVETSVAMERAMAQDPEGNAQKAWNAYGWKQALTMIHEYGLTIPREELLGWVACVYKLGFIHSQRKNAFGESMKEKAKEKIEKLERYIDQLESECSEKDVLRKQLQSKEAYIDQISEELEKECEKVKWYKETINQLKKENESLKNANNDLVDRYGNSSEIIEFREEVAEKETDRIYELLDSGTSIRKIAEILNIPKGRVEKAKKERALPVNE